MKGVSRRRTAALRAIFVAASASGRCRTRYATAQFLRPSKPRNGPFSVQLQGLVGLLSPKGSAPIQPSAMALDSFGF